MLWQMLSAAVALPKFAAWVVDVTKTLLKLGVALALGMGVPVGVGVGVGVGTAVLHCAGYGATNAGTAARSAAP